MRTEDIVSKILSACPSISKEQILQRLETVKRKTGGLISDESLLRMVAAELGCGMPNGTAFALMLSLKDLVPGLSNVTVAGRVVAIFSPKTFDKNRKGKFASLIIADRSSTLRVVLWNDKASLIESAEVKCGQIVRFSHGYTREDYGGRVELHIGEKSQVDLNPKDLEAKDYPTVGKFTTNIGELTHGHRSKRVNVAGRVEKLFSVSVFERQDSTSGKVMRFTLSDRTGEISVVVWNERVDELEKSLEIGAGLQVVNARVKKAMGDGLEIHVDGTVYVETMTPAEKFWKIADLKEDMKCVNIEGKVVAKPVVREVKTSKEEVLKLANFELKDETGGIWVSAWREHAESVKDLKVGDKLVIRDVYVKKGFGDQLELSTRNATSIVKNND